MAMMEWTLQGDFDRLMRHLDDGILRGSISASFEDGNEVALGDVRCATRVYERYSYLGKNRVSLTIALMGRGRDLHLTAITSGGSQAVFFKINTFGEGAFLDKLEQVVREFSG